MKKLSELYRTGDFKGEKHVPVINAPEKVKKGDVIELNVNIGQEIPHPNTLENHIKWIKVYYLPKDGNFPAEIGNYEFTSHGEFGLVSEPYVTVKFKIEKCGTIIATSYCNIHGLWESSKEITVEE